MKLRLGNLEFGDDSCIGVCTVGPQDRQHPNKMPFKGTLLVVDEPSDKPPHGAEGHRILVPLAVAQRRLSTLIGMGVNYSPELAAHAPQHKVGVITGAKIVGKEVKVNGFFWQRDFPKVKQDMQTGRLGMSMELQDVSVRDKDAPIWYLEDFHFSGATILFKSAAAYTRTSLSAAGVKQLGEEWGRLVKAEIQKVTRLAAAAATRKNLEGGRSMDKNKKHSAGGDGQDERLVKAIAAGVGPSIAAAVSESLKPFVTILKRQDQRITQIAASVEETKALSVAAASNDDEDETEDEDNIDASHDDNLDADSDDNDDDEDEEKEKKQQDDDDEDDDADLDAEIENLEDDTDEEDEPGEINKGAKNMGSKTTRTGKVGKSKHMAVKASASKRNISASSVIRELYASHRALRRKYVNLKAQGEERLESLQNKVEALEAQAEAYAEKTDRRSVSAELGNFLAKNNVDVRELRANGQKLAVEQVDEIFAHAPVELDPTTRMWFKHQLLEAGLMEQGEVHRGVN